jgi:L-ascorbate metabolism protein UlaG (beta-lactamase superfamily)
MSSDQRSDAATNGDDIRLTATITADRNSGWACIVLPDSARTIGTGRATKVHATVDGHAFDATLLPVGGGTHMLPVKAAVRTAIGKQIGDQVTVAVERRP